MPACVNGRNCPEFQRWMFRQGRIMDVGETQGWVELGENSWSQWKVGKGDFYRLLPAKVRERKRAG